MIKKRKPLLWIICIVLVLILFFWLSSYQAASQYKDAGLPFYAQDKWTNKIIYAESPKKIAQSMLASEEYFKGDIKLSYMDTNKAEITMRNYGTGDDTMAAIEYYVIAERKQPGWEITQFKMHWKCSRGLYWPNFWTTSGCI